MNKQKQTKLKYAKDCVFATTKELDKGIEIIEKKQNQTKESECDCQMFIGGSGKLCPECEEKEQTRKEGCGKQYYSPLGDILQICSEEDGLCPKCKSGQTGSCEKSNFATKSSEDKKNSPHSEEDCLSSGETCRDCGFRIMDKIFACDYHYGYNKGKSEAIKQVEKVYKKLFCCCSKMDGICKSCDDWELVKQKLNEVGK